MPSNDERLQDNTHLRADAAGHEAYHHNATGGEATEKTADECGLEQERNKYLVDKGAPSSSKETARERADAARKRERRKIDAAIEAARQRRIRNAMQRMDSAGMRPTIGDDEPAPGEPRD